MRSLERNEYIKSLIETLGFEESGKKSGVYEKKYTKHQNYKIQVDFNKEKIFFRDDNKLNVRDDKICVGDETTSNFSNRENFVVLECVNRLLKKGYEPKDLYLERKWSLGRTQKSGKADINVFGRDGKTLIIIECKTYGEEYEKEKRKMERNGGQLFSYLQQDRNAKFLCLYSSIFVKDEVVYENAIVKIKDRIEDKEAYESGDETVRLYEFAKNKEELYEVWKDTFNRYFHYNGIFDEDVNAYEIELKPLKRRNLKKLDDPKKVFYQFLEILRHNNISDNANAFNRMLSLFLCKIVDEEKEDNDILDFQVKEGEDTFEQIQDRLQKLYKTGMEKYLGEKIVYYEDKELEDIINKYPRQTSLERIEEIFKSIKYYTNNEFAFKEVHNKDLFKQNARVLNEVIKLFQNYQFKYTHKQQILGDFFELLLNHGVKQSEGQFFTPVPIARFMVLSLMLEGIINSKIKQDGRLVNFIPKILDFACGAGHFLTESIDEIQNILLDIDSNTKDNNLKEKIQEYKGNTKWTKNSIFGIEKDYRLARTSQIACFLNGDGDASIKFGDGLENHISLELDKEKFDVLIANPPYSVKSFKNYLNVDDEQYELMKCLGENSREIETLFIERMKQVLKEGGRAAIILPDSILTNANTAAYIKAREVLLQYFSIKAVIELGTSTFIATGSSTVILFVQRRKDGFNKDRRYIAEDLILNNQSRKEELDFIDSKKLLKKFTNHRGINIDDYLTLINKKPNEKINQWEMFKSYKSWFEGLTEVKNLKKRKTFKSLKKEEQKEQLENLFYEKILEKEKEKFYYFMLCLKEGTSRGDNHYYESQNIIVGNTGKTVTEQKQILGYEIKNDRDNQGIQIIGDTKLYDDSNYENSKTFASYIRNAYRNISVNDDDIDEELHEYIRGSNLIDMVNFDRIDFDKQINLNIQSKFEANDKWDFVKLKSFLTLEYGKSLPEKDRIAGEFPVMGSNGVIGSHNNFLIEGPAVIVGRKGSAGKVNYVEKNCYPIDTTFYVNIDSSKVNLKFAYYLLQLLNLEKLRGGLGPGGLNRNDVHEIKAPLPPLKIQEKIIKELEKVEDEEVSNIQDLEKLTLDIDNIINKVYNNDKYQYERLDSVCTVETGGTPKRKVKEYWVGGDINWVRSEVCENGFVEKDQVKEHITQKGLDESSAKLLKPNTTLVALVGATIGKVGYLTFESATNQNIAGLYPLREEEELHSKYLFYAVKNLYSHFIALGKGKYKMANKSFVESLKIPVPPYEDQKEIVKEIEKLEGKINSLKADVEMSDEKKQEILFKYLK